MFDKLFQVKKGERREKKKRLNFRKGLERKVKIVEKSWMKKGFRMEKVSENWIEIGKISMENFEQNDEQKKWNFT